MLRREAGLFDDLLDIGAIERLLGAVARRPTFRLVRDGTPVPAADYTRTARIGGTDVGDVADIDRIVDLVADGATVVVQSLQRTWPPLDRFCVELEETIGHPVQANAYLSPGGGHTGLGRHSDTHDVVVLQLEGAKAWDVEGIGPFTLRPGDSLYMPTGTAHTACAEAGYSLHLTIGILTVTRGDVLRRLVSELGDDRALPLGFTRPDRRAALLEDLTASLDDTRRLLAGADLEAVAEREVMRAVRRRRGSSTGRLRTLLDPDALTADVVLVRRHQLAVEPADGDWLVAEFAGRRLRMPASTGPSLATIAAADRLRVGDLPGLDDDDRAVLARRLVREGVLAIAEPPNR